MQTWNITVKWYSSETPIDVTQSSFKHVTNFHISYDLPQCIENQMIKLKDKGNKDKDKYYKDKDKDKGVTLPSTLSFV